jgi:hypothetical protein
MAEVQGRVIWYNRKEASGGKISVRQANRSEIVLVRQGEDSDYTQLRSSLASE